MILSAMFAATILLADTTPAAATAAATVTPATVAAPGQVAPAQVAKTEKPRMICRTDPVTGSLFPKKTCYAADDYARTQEEQRRNLEQMQANRPIRTN